MKRVSFEVAKAIKEAGYPQDRTNSHYTNCGELIYYGIAGETGFDAPTYLEVWLWLWREKKKWIDVSFSLDEDNWTFMQNPSPCNCGLYNDPEEAIEQAIKYLVENDLIKSIPPRN